MSNSKELSQLSQQLLDLHVAHELERLTATQIEKDIKEEVNAFLTLAADKKLNDFLSSEQLISNLHGAVTLQPNLDKTIKKIVIAIYNDKAHEKTSLSNLLGDKELEQFLDKILNLDILRNELIQSALHNKIVKEIITDLLYSGISRYIAQSNALAKKVPGAKTMMSIGKGFINKAAPDLEDRLEYQIKKTIGITMPEILAQTEKFIAKSVDDELIKEITFEVWNSLKEKPLAGFKNLIKESDVQEITELVLQQIHSDANGDGDNNKATNANYVMRLLETGINTFFKDYGNKKLSVLIKDLDLSEDYLNVQLSGFLPSIIDALKASGHLEQRIRARLSDFYSSTAAQALLK